MDIEEKEDGGLGGNLVRGRRAFRMGFTSAMQVQSHERVTHDA